MTLYSNLKKKLTKSRIVKTYHSIDGQHFLSLSVGNPNAWRLGRIDELDHETAV